MIAADGRADAPDRRSNREHLRGLAIEAMRARGFDPGFPPDAKLQAASLTSPARSTEEPVRDLRGLLWCSIDNDDSRDLDQLSVAEPAAGGAARVLVAIADVDALVFKGSPIDRHAALNTTSVYTPAAIFPMLPEKLSTDLTSLGEGQDRLAVVIELIVTSAGSLDGSSVYGAMVHNRAKLAYDAVGAWLTGAGPLPAAIADVRGMAEQLQLQDRAAQALSRVRHDHGALDFETIEVETLFDRDAVIGLRRNTANRAKSLIENLMIVANGVCARFLDAHRVPSIRRVVKTPERWDRIVELAARTGERLPGAPDSRALARYLEKQKAANPDRFPDLSQAVIRLLGSGEYVVERPGAEGSGHFGLAAKDYTHSTAPNRRYPDLVTQRLVKAVLAGHATPYTADELEQVAAHCTRQEDEANRVERQVRKSAAALVMSSRLGERFQAIVTGASSKGTFVRVTTPPVEGMLVAGSQGLDVGDHVEVRLSRVDIDRGFIDFERSEP